MTVLIPLHDRLYSAGQPSRDEFAALAAQGVRTVINLRAPGEPCDFDEAGLMRELALRYITLPISGAADLEPQRLRQLAEALALAEQHGPTLLHCASANRVGAALALIAAWQQNLPPTEALQLGLRAGLTTLQPAVEALLGLS